MDLCSAKWRCCAATAAAVALALSASVAHAYRPFDGTDADVAEYKEFELELGPVGYLREGATPTLVAPAVVLNYGLVPRLEIVLEGRGLFTFERAPGSGVDAALGDAIASAKYVLREGALQDASGPSIAAELGVLLPTTPGDATGASLDVIMSHRIEGIGSAHLNVMGAIDRAHRYESFTSVILEGPAAWPIRPVSELYLDEHFGLHPELSALFGAIWPVREGLALDAAGRVAWDGEPIGELRLGFTWSFAVFAKEKD